MCCAAALANVLRPGVVAALDAAAARVRVAYAEGDRRPTTGWLPWVAPAAGAQRRWRAPAVGEQALILAPGGNLAQGVVLAGIYTDAFPPPSADPAVETALYADGARIEYDAAAHRLRAVLPAGGSAAIDAPQGVVISGDVTVKGELQVTGDVSAGGDVSDSAASMRDMRAKYNRHKHALTPPDPPPTPRM